MTKQRFPLVDEVLLELQSSVDEKTQQSFQRFFKEKVKYYGVKAGEVNRIAKKYRTQIKTLTKNEVFAMAEELWRVGYGEAAWIAADWIYEFRKQYQKTDIQLFQRWISQYIDDWAKCDTFCNHSVGAYFDLYPGEVKIVFNWAKSANRWLRRAAAVSLILAARSGDFLNEAFKLADILLLDKEDLVQKGYGWLLKEASRQHQQQVFDYLMAHKQTMPRTAYRYALEKMPAELRAKAMAK